jgi:CheY-like chemotaxis protein
MKSMSEGTQQPNVLLVEDSEDDAFFFRRAMKRVGIPCEFIHVWDGGAATAYLKDHQGQPHLVFLDLKIPVLNGFEVLKWIRDEGIKGPLEIVILSGSDDPRDIAAARELGVSDYFVKPVSIQQLTDKITMWCNKR